MQLNGIEPQPWRLRAFASNSGQGSDANGDVGSVGGMFCLAESRLHPLLTSD